MQGISQKETLCSCTVTVEHIDIRARTIIVYRSLGIQREGQADANSKQKRISALKTEGETNTFFLNHKNACHYNFWGAGEQTFFRPALQSQRNYCRLCP